VISYFKARQWMVDDARSRAPHLGVERMPAEGAAGRVSSEDVLSAHAVPGFDNSAMDGFAVRSHDCPARLKVRGVVVAGDSSQTHPVPMDGACFEIMTGAPIPVGYDAVVKVEDVRRLETPSGAAEIEVRDPVPAGQHIRRAGLDFGRQSLVLARGERIAPEHVMALASVGVTEVSVRRLPRVAVISTGGEIVSAGTASLLPGQVRNSTTPYLLSALAQYGVSVLSAMSCGDDPSQFLRALAAALELKPDLILTTGGVSKGKYDFIPEVVKALGAKQLFHEVAMRPGKPGFFASFSGGPALFGMPGNPVSTAVALRFFVWPWIEALLDLPEEPAVWAELDADAAKPPELQCFYKATFSQGAGEVDGPKVSLHAGQPSFMVRPILESNAWAVLPETQTPVAKLAAGVKVRVFPLHPNQAFGSIHSRRAPAEGPAGGCC